MSFDLRIENGDLKIDANGTVSKVTGNEKLRQDLLKILLTPLGDNKYHSKYGSHAGKLQIGSHADEKLVSLDITSSARSAIRNLMSLQRAQSKKQSLSPGEIIIDILNLEVARDKVDPRLYNIFVSVLTQELDKVESSVTIRIA